MLLLVFPIRCRIKAGSADDYEFRYTLTTKVSNFIFNDQVIDTSKYKVMIAAGESMKDYEIHRGDKVFIEPYISEDDKKNILDYPILAIRLYGPRMPFDSKQKLRKFVGYVESSTDWDNVYEKYKDRIKKDISKEQFKESCNKSYRKGKFELNKSNIGILSETFDVSLQKYHYSVHSIKNVYGKVKYVCGRVK